MTKLGNCAGLRYLTVHVGWQVIEIFMEKVNGILSLNVTTTAERPDLRSREPIPWKYFLAVFEKLQISELEALI